MRFMIQNPSSQLFTVQFLTKLLLVLFVAVVFQSAVVTMVRPGGIGNELACDSDSQEVADKVRDSVEERTNTSYSQFTVVSYKKQTVAGTNYFMKINVGDDNYLHVKAFKPLPHTKEDPRYTDHLSGKGKDDEIEFF
ncbi:cystatin-A-like [Convolutriloba macropyga]|uniref:cystatin-A-like n=1 Tax=Convolutriloba macropyga TaxID=536237 RepID=UPI003F51E2DE